MPAPTFGQATSCGSDQTLIKALSHPVRANALTILNQRVASPKEIAGELKEEIGKVSYHVKELRNLGCVELVDTAQRRGATEHYYRGVAQTYMSDSFWATLSTAVRNGISVTGLKVLIESAREAVAAGTFDARVDRHLSCLTLGLDPQGWKEANRLLNETLERLTEIGSESEARAEGECIRATFGLLGFESPAETV
jgi:DNA-binding transcriptional ArsR family regulator